MRKHLKIVLFGLVGFIVSSPALGQQFEYRHIFEQGIGYAAGTSQYDDWLNYRASLPSADVTSITLSGSLDTAGRTCSDPAKAQQIVNAISDGATGLHAGTVTLSVDCDGFYWNVGSCSVDAFDANNVELNVGILAATMCRCTADNYTIRPGISGASGSLPSWGGITTPACGGATQELVVAVNLSADVDGDGVLDNDDFCPWTAPGDLVDVAGCSDAQVDSDGDGICNPDAAHGGPSMCVGVDNCPIDSNPGQEDFDNDTVGDACDVDVDGDGVPNVTDPHPRSDLSSTVVVNSCDSGAANDVLSKGSSIADLVNDAFFAGGEDAVEDLVENFEDRGIFSEYVAEAIEECAEGDDDDEDGDDDEEGDDD